MVVSVDVLQGQFFRPQTLNPFPSAGILGSKSTTQSNPALHFHRQYLPWDSGLRASRCWAVVVIFSILSARVAQNKVRSRDLNALNHKPYTLNSKPYTLNPSLDPKPQRSQCLWTGDPRVCSLGSGIEPPTAPYIARDVPHLLPKLQGFRVKVPADVQKGPNSECSINIIRFLAIASLKLPCPSNNTIKLFKSSNSIVLVTCSRNL